MTTTIAMIAFPDDVACLNRNIGRKHTGFYVDHQLQGPITPADGGRIMPEFPLARHVVALTEAGLAVLDRAIRADRNVKRLRLDREEAAGLLLAEWAAVWGAALDGGDVGYAGPRTCEFALYKRALAKRRGDEREARHLMSARRTIWKEHVAERQYDDQFSGTINHLLEANKDSCTLPDYVPE